jgi:hypothetical protein
MVPAAASDASPYVARYLLPPQGWWEYALVALAGAVALLAFIWFVLGFFRPGEDDPSHIKRTVLLDDLEPRKDDDG